MPIDLTRNIHENNGIGEKIQKKGVKGKRKECILVGEMEFKGVWAQ